MHPPPTAEELALKEQVTQVLASQGVLAKLKAELRAAVFQVMHEREGFAEKGNANDSVAPKMSDFPGETGTTALALIVECLQFFRWEHALGVLLAETNAVHERYDGAVITKKLGLDSSISGSKPTLFQLIEARLCGDNVASVRPMATAKYGHFDEDDDGGDEERPIDDVPAVMAKLREPEVIARTSVSAEVEKPEVAKVDEAESSAEIEESMAEEVPSGSDLEESNFADKDQDTQEEEENPYRVASVNDNTKQSPRKSQAQFSKDSVVGGSAREDTHDDDDEDGLSLAAPPPAPATLPTLPPLVGEPHSTLATDADDDFDTEMEAERLRNLDAALQAMEAEDDTGTLQQLKASLQMELQEQDSFASSVEAGRAEDTHTELEPSKSDKEEEEDDDDGYGYGSDFEEEEEIASEISEEMESMADLSDNDDESENEAAASTTETQPPRVLQSDTRVDSEDALNSYDYIEDVERNGW
ncbi:hypothetical protein PHYBOEH_004479 [Phytophthora boehmeriae]|uniref:FGFR1 oncogene partner (FOP) N-terminal dimerisation domain-containing protein n=1 Tax=Phytophthora boehmeriae TaxID=109152 RepID=A0A8T1WLM5_9STRA|nr:hypothetical protein PHYBOEH_004479 [Phytophthora boehmeriae]